MKFYRWMLDKYLVNDGKGVYVSAVDLREFAIGISLAILQILVDIYDEIKNKKG